MFKTNSTPEILRAPKFVDQGGHKDEKVLQEYGPSWIVELRLEGVFIICKRGEEMLNNDCPAKSEP